MSLIQEATRQNAVATWLAERISTGPNMRLRFAHLSVQECGESVSLKSDPGF